MQQFTKPPKFPLSLAELMPRIEQVDEISYPDDATDGGHRMSYRDWVVLVLSDLGEATSRQIYDAAIMRGMRTNGSETTAMRKIRNALNIVAVSHQVNGQSIWSLQGNNSGDRPNNHQQKKETVSSADNADFVKCLVAVVQHHIDQNDMPESMNVSETISDLMSYKIGLQVAGMAKFNESMFKDGLNGQIPVGWTPFAEVAKRVLEQYASVPEMHRVICKIVQ